ncbi:uncharacterized protein LOC127011833 isoform X2 [Drosophila biarmipes]|uniref:uncharacterized protein LOC127011833 isoform X2 n=1 Tax=Drosophila biarmipes TaxID=125945 RepID=UPI0021CC9E57|nr:uncharacterized protein LOC127011833 isoform X2 [Drosophila biarmipes]
MFFIPEHPWKYPRVFRHVLWVTLEVSLDPLPRVLRVSLEVSLDPFPRVLRVSLELSLPFV